MARGRSASNSSQGDDVASAVARLVEPASPYDHLVGFYDSEAFLVRSVVRFLAPALRAGDNALVVETGDHRDQLESALTAEGIDVAAATRSGHLLAVDADELLSSFMVAGSPDPSRFAARVGRLIDQAAADGGPVRIHGEMVALLWARGEVAAALALEDLWNELLATHPCALLCTYPMRAFDDEQASEAFRTVCHQHAAVLPSESYSQLADAESRRRAVALLQHEATVGINARATLRQRQHELEEELRRSRELGRLRDELISTMSDTVQTATGQSAEPRRRTVETFTTTALRVVRRTLHADCAFEPAVDDGATDSGDTRIVEAESGSQPADSIAVPVAAESSHGVLRARLDGERPATREDRVFAQSVAELLARAIEHDAAQRRLQHQALADRLTGLPTRTLLVDRLDQAVRRSDRAAGRVAVLFIDLDGFKEINDRFGHAIGDRVLSAAAARLRDTMRPGDTLARIGGDEFAAVCEGVADEAHALAVAERLREAVGDPLPVDGLDVTVTVTVSIGVVLDEHGRAADRLLNDADIAMYDAKLLGRDRCAMLRPHRRAAFGEFIRWQ